MGAARILRRPAASKCSIELVRRLVSLKDTFIYKRIRKIERGGLAPRVRALGQIDGDSDATLPRFVCFV